MNNTDVKLCKDCRYLTYQSNLHDPVCKHESGAKPINPVDGSIAYHLAAQSRKWPTLCGKDAVHFQPKRSFIQWLKEVL